MLHHYLDVLTLITQCWSGAAGKVS